MTGPTKIPVELTVTQVATARVRRCAGTLASSRAAAFGTVNAPPAPWLTRASRSGQNDCETRASALPTPNSAKPIWYVRRRPTIAAMVPTLGSTVRFANMKVTNNQRAAISSAPMSRVIVGRLTARALLSSIAKPKPMAQVSGASVALGSGR